MKYIIFSDDTSLPRVVIFDAGMSHSCVARLFPWSVLSAGHFHADEFSIARGSVTLNIPADADGSERDQETIRRWLNQ